MSETIIQGSAMVRTMADINTAQFVSSDTAVAAEPTMTEAEVSRSFQAMAGSSGANGGTSVMARTLPASSASTPPMSDPGHRLSNPEVNRIVGETLTGALGDRYTRLDTGSLMIYLDATVANTEGLTMASLDRVQVFASGLDLSDSQEQALVRDIQTALSQSTELEGLLVSIAGKTVEGSDGAQVYLASDIRFGGTSHLSSDSIRLPLQGPFNPVAGQLGVTGRTAEGVTYTRTFDNVMIAPVGQAGIPQAGEGGDPYVIEGTEYHPVPYKKGSAYHAGCGYVLLATVDDATSTPHEILRSMAFTQAGRGHLTFTPPRGVVMSGS